MIRLRRRRLHLTRHWRLSESTSLPSHRTLRSSPLRSFFQKRRRVLAYYSVFIYSSFLFSSRFRFAEGSSSIPFRSAVVGVVLHHHLVLRSPPLLSASPSQHHNTPICILPSMIPFNFPFLYLYLFFVPPFPDLCRPFVSGLGIACA